MTLEVHIGYTTNSAGKVVITVARRYC